SPCNQVKNWKVWPYRPKFTDCSALVIGRSKGSEGYAIASTVLTAKTSRHSTASASRRRQKGLLSSRLVPGCHPAPAPVLRDQLVGGPRAPGPARVALRVPGSLPGLDQGIHDLPRTLDLASARE